MYRIILTVIFLITFTLSSFAQEMSVHLPKLKLEKKDDSYILYEDSIDTKIALKYYQQLGKWDGIYKIPKTDDYYLVIAGERVNNYSYPSTAFLFKESQGLLTEQFRSRSFGDRYKLKPLFFVGEKSVLILAEKEYLGYHGIEAFEFRDNQMSYLGKLNLAHRISSDSGFHYNANPLKYYYKAEESEQAKVYFQNDSYKITLKGEFYEDFEFSRGIKISSKDSTVTYQLNQNGFQLLEVNSDSKDLKKREDIK